MNDMYALIKPCPNVLLLQGSNLLLYKYTEGSLANCHTLTLYKHNSYITILQQSIDSVRTLRNNVGLCIEYSKVKAVLGTVHIYTKHTTI